MVKKDLSKKVLMAATIAGAVLLSTNVAKADYTPIDSRQIIGDDNVNFTNNSFEDLSTDQSYGGAIYNWKNAGNVTISGSYFKNNVASSTSSYNQGGAIYIHSGANTLENIITNTIFEGNKTIGKASRGGAVYFNANEGNNTTVNTISGSTFIKNESIREDQPLNIMGSAIYQGAGTLNLNNNIFGGESIADANIGTSIVVANDSTINLSGNTFQYNISKKEGVLSFNNANARGNFEGINTFDHNDGHAVYVFNGSPGNTTNPAGVVTFKDGSKTYFTNNSALNDQASEKNGGAIFNSYNATTTFEEGSEATFTENTAQNGGAVYNTGTMTISDGTVFTNNSATAKGGAIYNAGTLNIGDGTVFEGNSANYGAGFANYGSTAITNIGDNVTFRNNYLTGEDKHGSAFYNKSGTVIAGDGLTLIKDEKGSIHDCGIYSNEGGDIQIGDNFTVDKFHEAIVIAGDHTLTIGDNMTIKNSGNGINLWGTGVVTGEFGDNALFENNTGRVFEILDYATAGSKLTVGDNLVVRGNNLTSSSDYFGNIYNAANTDMEFKGVSLFENNTTQRANGNAGVFQNWGQLTFDGSAEFISNSAYGTAGALRNRAAASGADFKDTAVFSGNKAFSNGGAIENQGTLSFAKSVSFLNNISGAVQNYVEDPNGIYIDDETGIHYSVALGDLDSGSAKLGGAIYNTGTATFSDDAEFIGNKAGYGGAVFNTATVSFDADSDYKFRDNIANSDGGAIYTAADMSVANAEFISNTAVDGDGGAIVVDGAEVTVTDSSFAGNIAGGKGGAIWTGATLNINAKNTDVVFSDNKQAYVDANTYTANDIYSDNGTVNLNAANGKTISITGGIDGDSSTLAINSDALMTGTVNVTGNLNNQTVTLNKGELNLAKGSSLTGTTTVTTSAGSTINTIDSVINHFNSGNTVTLGTNTNVKFDARLADADKDIDTFIIGDGSTVNISGAKVYSDIGTTRTLNLSNKGNITVDPSLKVITSSASYTITGNSANDGSLTFTNSGEGGINIAVKDTDALTPEIVDYTMTGDENYKNTSSTKEKTVQNAEFNLDGNGKSIVALDDSTGMKVDGNSTMNISNVTFKEFNEDNDGVVKNEGGSVTLDNVTFDKTNEYAVFNQDGDLSSQDSTYNAGVVNGDGSTSASAEFVGDTFTADSASNGSAIVNNAGSSVELTNITFQGGGSAKRGRAITNAGTYNNDDNDISGYQYDNGAGLENTSIANPKGDHFTNNIADQESRSVAHGGGAVWNSGTITFEDSTTPRHTEFTSNQSYTDGGAIYNSAGTLTVSNAIFTSNLATHDATTGAGGAIYNAVGATANITDSSFTSNSAALGGAIYNAGTLSVTDSTFTTNTALVKGADIYNAVGGNATVLASAGNMTVNDIYNAGTLNLNAVTAKTLTIGAIDGISGTGLVTINSGAQTGTVVFNGNVANDVNVFAGTLDNAGTLSGATTVATGALLNNTTGTISGDVGITGNVDNDSTISGDVTINAGGVLYSTAAGLTGTVTNSGTFNLEGAALRDIAGAAGTTVLQNSVAVASDYTIAGTLDLNGQTINMQDSDLSAATPAYVYPSASEPASYQTLTVGSLNANGGNFKIDVDMKNNSGYANNSDKIVITDGTNNAGTLNLTSINVTDSGDAGVFADYITYLTTSGSGVLTGLTIDPSAVIPGTITSDHRSFTFANGTVPGKLNVTIADTQDTIQNFIQGTGSITTETTYSLVGDKVETAALGTTNRTAPGALKNLSIYLNDHNWNGAGYAGAVVDTAYTLNVSSATTAGDMSAFATALETVAGGTLNVDNLTFLANTGSAIVNAGNANITGSVFGDDTVANANINAAGYGGAIKNSGNLVLTDTSFLMNAAGADETSAGANDGTQGFGGAIYSTGNVTVNADTKTVNFTDNLAFDSGTGAGFLAGRGQAIFMQGTSGTPVTLALNAKGSNSIVFANGDDIDGQYYDVNINTASGYTGTVTLDDVLNAGDITIGAGTVSAKVVEADSLTLTAGSLATTGALNVMGGSNAGTISGAGVMTIGDGSTSVTYGNTGLISKAVTNTANSTLTTVGVDNLSLPTKGITGAITNNGTLSVSDGNIASNISGTGTLKTASGVAVASGKSVVQKALDVTGTLTNDGTITVTNDFVNSGSGVITKTGTTGADLIINGSIDTNGLAITQNTITVKNSGVLANPNIFTVTGGSVASAITLEGASSAIGVVDNGTISGTIAAASGGTIGVVAENADASLSQITATLTGNYAVAAMSDRTVNTKVATINKAVAGATEVIVGEDTLAAITDVALDSLPTTGILTNISVGNNAFLTVSNAKAGATTVYGTISKEASATDYDLKFENTNASPGSININGVVSGVDDVEIASGTVNFNANVTADDITVDGGAVLNNAAAKTTTADVTVAATGMLNNAGTISGDLTNSGTVNNYITSGTTTEGTITGNVVNNASATITTNASNLATGATSTIKNDGTITFTGGNISKDIAKVTAGNGIVEIKAGSGAVGLNGKSITDNSIKLTSGKFDVTDGTNANLDVSSLNLIANGGKLSVQDGKYGTITLGDVDATANDLFVAVDAQFTTGSRDTDDVFKGSSDKLTLAAGKAVSGTNLVKISDIAITADPAATEFKTQIADDTIKAKVDVSATTLTTLTPGAGSILLSYNSGTGYLTGKHSDLVNAIKSTIGSKMYDVAAAGENISAASAADLTLGGTSLSITANNKTITGGANPIKINTSGQTLSIAGGAAGNAVLTGFSSKAIDNTSGGTVNLTKVTMTGNTVDVDNSGASAGIVNLSDVTMTDAITNVINDGEGTKGVFLTGTNNINKIADTGADHDAGKTTISSGTSTVGSIIQKSVSIASGATLNIDADKLATTSGTANAGTLNLSGTTTPGSSSSTATTITGVNGTTNIKSGNVTFASNVTQSAVNVDAGTELTNAARLDAATTTVNGKLINSNTIASSSGTNNKVVVNAGGTFTSSGNVGADITNNGNVDNTGTITNKSTIVNNAGATFDNTGVINSPSFTNKGVSGLTPAGVVNSTAGGIRGGIDNQGILNLTAGNLRSAITDSQATATGVTNIAGTVNTNGNNITQDSVTVGKDKTGAAVAGTLNNADTITAGTIVTNANGTLANTGTVIATAAANAIDNNGTITNAAGATISGTAGAATTINNSGSITNAAATTTPAAAAGNIIAAITNDGNNASITNNGTITGSITNAAGKDSIIVNNSGSITGNVNNGNGSNNVINNLAGGTIGTTSANTLTNNGGTVNNTAGGTIASAITNTSGTVNTLASQATGGISNDGTVNLSGASGTTGALASAITSAAGTPTAGITNVAGVIDTNGKNITQKTVNVGQSGTTTTTPGTLNNADTILATDINVNGNGVFNNTGNIGAAGTPANITNSGDTNLTAGNVIANAITNTTGTTDITGGSVTAASVTNTAGATTISGGTTNVTGTVTNTSGTTTLSGGTVNANAITNTTGTTTISGGTVGVTTNIKNNGAAAADVVDITGGTVTAATIENAGKGTTNINNTTGTTTATTALTSSGAGTTNVNTTINTPTVNANAGSIVVNGNGDDQLSDKLANGAGGSNVNLGAGGNVTVNTNSLGYSIDNTVTGSGTTIGTDGTLDLNGTDASGYQTADDSAKTKFTVDSPITNAIVNVNEGQLNLPDESKLSGSTVYVAGPSTPGGSDAATINTMDGNSNTYNNNYVFGDQSEVKFDVDALAQNSDFFASPDETAGSEVLTDISLQNLDKIVYKNTDINLLGTSGLNNLTVSSELQGRKFQAMTPIRIMEATIGANGILNIHPSSGRNDYKSFNPAAVVGPVAAQVGGYLNQLNSYEEAFRNLDMKMLMTREERQAYKMANRYASEVQPRVFSPTYLPEKESAGWFRPYASFEKVGLKYGPKVGNVMYGSYFGGDSSMKELSNGWDYQYSVYVGYNGSHQNYQGNSIYQNGGNLGATAIWYKDNFFTALTANVGASVADASTMYGSEDFPMLMAGVASKTGYNWELADGKFIIQPSYLMSYTFVNSFDYTNAAGIRINSDPLNAINIAPGLKFIGNLKNGWQPYAGVQMVWNIMDKADFHANDIPLPEMSVRPYFQYGVGLQKRWGDRFTGFGQAMMRNGGRTGIALSAGFRWALGKDSTAADYSSNSSKAKTTVKSTAKQNANVNSAKSETPVNYSAEAKKSDAATAKTAKKQNVFAKFFAKMNGEPTYVVTVPAKK